MYCPYILEKNNNFLNDYSLNTEKPLNFAISGKMLVKYPVLQLDSMLNSLDSYTCDKEENMLKKKISYKYNLDTRNIILGCGANGILQNLINMFFTSKQDNLVTPFYTFSQAIYGVNSRGGKVRLAKVRKDFTIDIENLKKSINKNTKMVFICNPNNPTGLILDPKEIIAFAKTLTIPFVVSEASIAFSDKQSLLYCHDLPENLIVLRSFSKEYGLSGIRLGYAYMSDSFKNKYLQKSPTNQTSLISIIIANKVFSLKEVEKNIEIVKINRSFLFSSLKNLGIPCLDSQSNTIMISKPLNEKIFTSLAQKGISVTKIKGINGELFMRISVLNKKENTILLSHLKKIKEEESENFFSNQF